jgi:hypothetical protein
MRDVTRGLKGPFDVAQVFPALVISIRRWMRRRAVAKSMAADRSEPVGGLAFSELHHVQEFTGAFQSRRALNSH